MMPMLPASDPQRRTSHRLRGFDSIDLVIC
jgi:hypothetical protein